MWIWKGRGLPVHWITQGSSDTPSCLIKTAERDERGRSVAYGNCLNWYGAVNWHQHRLFLSTDQCLFVGKLTLITSLPVMIACLNGPCCLASRYYTTVYWSKKMVGCAIWLVNLRPIFLQWSEHQMMYNAEIYPIRQNIWISYNLVC